MNWNLPELESARPLTRFVYFASTPSTMTEAARLVSLGARANTVVIAEEQTAGIGRYGRRWESPEGEGLYCSVLLEPKLESLPVASLAIGVAVFDAVRRLCPRISLDLRWPNDILARERKLAGILPHWVAPCIVAGIGVNVNQHEFPERLRTEPTSIRLENGRPASREALLLEILAQMDQVVELRAAEICLEFARRSSYVRGRRVCIEETGDCGATVGLDESGFLMVRLQNGTVRRLTSEGVRPAP